MAAQKQNAKQKGTRLVALVIAGVMVFSVLAAAILSQVV